ncbi:MAG: hypothetical protein II685_02055 [Clostridia bacterium]|nr:hypothetical protein [Clostridia bacterium]
MDVFDLFAKISLDTREYEEGLKKAIGAAKNVKTAVSSLSSPIDKVKDAFNKVAHPVQTVKDGFETLKTKTEALRHPIETLKRNFDGLRQELQRHKEQYQTLKTAYSEAKQTLKEVTEEYKKSAKATGKTSDETKSWAELVREAEKDVKTAKDALDGYGKKVKETGEETEKTEKKTSTFKETLKAILTADFIKKGISALWNGIKKIGSGIINITKQAVSSYGDYQQLLGGAQKIFNEMDFSIIQRDAANAYKTLNLSAAEYLESINQVGGAFASTMGDAKGYEIAKRGLQAVSDYATGMGKSVDELNTKYQMITRATSSYQSIADQFSGILPQTSKDFLEQAQAAGLLSKEYGKLTEVPVAEYQQAVTAMLEKGVADLGFMNNTMNESAGTLTGSLAMAKKAWENLVTGFADPDADLGLLISNFAESAEAAFKNILPISEQALKSIGTFVEKIAPIIEEKLPSIVEEALPSFLSAAMSIVNGIIAALPTLIGILAEQAPTIINQLVAALLDNLDAIVDAAFQLIFGLAQGLIDNLPTLLEKAGEIISKLCLEIIANIDQFIDVSIDLITALANGLIQNIDILIDKAPEIVYKLVVAIIKNAPKLLLAAIELIVQIVAGITQSFGKLIEKGREIVDKVKSGFSEKVEAAKKWGRDLMDNFVKGIKEKWENLKQSVSNVASSIKNLLGFSEPKEGPLSNFHTYAPDMMKLFAKGVKDNTPLVTDQLKKSFNFEPMITPPTFSYDGVSYSQSNQEIINAIDRLGKRFDSALFTFYFNEREFGRAVREFA